ncbi:hypothetical protein M404DRAFT_30939 [Pisolithus tinctorius Marx 270]|uniref:Uncharacterized protein n=1 Tax=Pisolithus tinctorius Marx 270 TaxID=870435 RepID=A0A0C3IPV5_PISTI|nr:hypothetical protein M404DRAFT_30939 [Pisolithus tinctorius Marx 270]
MLVLNLLPAAPTRNHDTGPEEAGSSVARCPTHKPCPRRPSQGLTEKEHEEEYLNSFRSTMVPLKDSTKLDRCTALKQLCGGMITMQDIVDEDDRSVSLLAVPSNTPSDNKDHHKQSVPPSTTSDAHLCHGPQSVSNDEDDCEQFPPNIPSDAHLSHALQNMSSNKDDREQSRHPPCTPQKVSYNDQSMESEEDEQAVAVVMHSEDPADFGEVYHASNVNHQPSDTADTEGTVDTEDTGELRKHKGKSTRILPKVGRCSESDEDGLAAENGPLTLRHGRLPINALQKAQALSVRTTQEAQAIADEYGKTLVSIMAAAGLTTKATQAESVWNIHQAWYVSTNPKLSDESMNDYYSRQMKHYESHKDEGEHPELWAKIRKFWNESINGTKDMSSKAMVSWVMMCRDSFTQSAQTWSNVEGIHVFGCVIYSGNDKAVHQAQGVFAGSSLCMQLASERQTDVAKLLDFLSMIIKYKILDSAASVLLPNFALLLQKSYDRTLALQSQEKFHKSLQLSLSDLLAEAPQMKPRSSHTIVDWPAGVLAVGPDFNVKCLNADELCALTVPFLKEQMEQDYDLEAPAEEEEDHFVPVPASLFYLKHWTADQLQLLREADPKAFDIPLVVNTLHHSLRLVSDSQAFVKHVIYNMVPPTAALQPCTPTATPATDHRSVIKNIQKMEARMTQAHHREGPTAVWLSMFIGAPHTRDTTIHLMMKMATPVIIISATECSLMIPPSPFISTMDTDPYLSASTTPHGHCCGVARQ